MNIALNFNNRLNIILNEEFSDDYFAAVGIVQCGDRWLLGLARNTNDDRNGTWVFPGGGIKGKESAEKGAEREVREETGIKCTAVGKPFSLPGKRGVAFVHCKAKSGQELINNHEFTALGFFSLKEMKALKLYKNVLKLIERIK